MPEPRFCSQCGAELPADVPAGVCPQCVLQVGLEDSVHVSVLDSESPASRPTPSAGIDPGPTTPAGTGFVPPTVEELQRHFPQMEILELLGRGGMGAVYKARQPALDRLVALKILPPEVGRDPQFAERFTREARALAKLSHPNIVMVYEFGQSPSPQPSPRSTGEREQPSENLYYLIMEFVDGVNLRQTIRSGTMSPAEALKIVPQICEALQFAHEEGVVHRDIKPENILLDKRGRLKIADFGLAKLLGRADSALMLTQTFQVMGTLHYMAPEQFERPTSVDHRADIYSLGVVFYELLTGVLPLGRYALPSERATIDSRLDDVVLKTLEREPDRRYQHASDVKTDIESISRSDFVARAPAASMTRMSPRDEAPAARPQAVELSAAEWESARRKVQAPGLLLMLAGILNLMPCLLTPLVPLISFVIHDVPHMSAPRELNPAVWSSPTALSISTTGPLAPPLVLAAMQEAAPMMARASWGVGALEIVLLPFLLLSFPLGILMILGGYKMRKLELYGLAMIAVLAALLPCSPGFFISFPIGVWALLVLWNPDVKAAFGTKPVFAEVIPEKKPPLPPVAGLPDDEFAIADSEARTIGPGNALVVTGVLTALVAIGFFMSFAVNGVGELFGARSAHYMSDTPVVGPSVGAAIMLALAMAIVYGGLQLRSRGSYGWATLASVLAVFPISPVCLLGCWVGAWSFLVLQSSIVKQGFRAVRRRAAPATFAKALPGFALILGPPALLVAAGLGISLLAQSSRPEPVGTVLVYEVNVPRSDGITNSNAALEFCEARVNTGKRKIAQLKIDHRHYDGGGTVRVEIGVYGRDPVVANRIEERLAAQGKIEFNILADVEKDATLITRARAITGAEVPAENAKPESDDAPIPSVARWVAVSHRVQRSLQDAFGEYSSFATRRTPEGSLEILVLVDPLNVTQKEITAASPVVPEGVSLAFNSEGARRMRTLTSRPEYLRTNFKVRRMGLIIDGELFTAPHLETAIADQMHISHFGTADELNDFVSLVRSGPAPGTVKQVSRKTVAQ